MHDIESIHHRYEQLKVFPPDSRIRQVRGRAALDLARARNFTLDVDIRVWRARTGEGSYDNYWDVRPDVLFERGIDVSHETVRVWCAKLAPDLAEALRRRKPRRSRTWHLDEMRVVLGGVTHWLWRAVNEYGDVLRRIERAPGPLGLVRCCKRTVIWARPSASLGGCSMIRSRPSGS